MRLQEKTKQAEKLADMELKSGIRYINERKYKEALNELLEFVKHSNLNKETEEHYTKQISLLNDSVDFLDYAFKACNNCCN